MCRYIHVSWYLPNCRLASKLIESQVMQAAMGVTIKANAPFDSATFDWTEDEGIGMCAQTCAFECWSDELRAQLLGWALFWAIYSQYPGLC